MNIGEIIKVQINPLDDNSFIYGIITELSKESLAVNTMQIIEDHINMDEFPLHAYMLPKPGEEHLFYSYQLMPISEEEIKRLSKVVVFG